MAILRSDAKGVSSWYRDEQSRDFAVNKPLTWLGIAGLAALAVGMMLATHRTRSPVASRPGPDAGAAGPTNDMAPGDRAVNTNTTKTNDHPGGAKK